MSTTDLAERLSTVHADALREVRAVEAKLPEHAAMAKAGAVMAKRVPDKLLARVAASVKDGRLEASLRAKLGDGGTVAAMVPVVATLMAELAEASGEELLALTDASLRMSARLAGRAEALQEQANALVPLLQLAGAIVRSETASGPPEPAESSGAPVATDEDVAELPAVEEPGQ